MAMRHDPTPEDLRPWLGPAWDQLAASEQLEQFAEEARRLDERYPDPDEADLKEAALYATVQYLLSELRPDDAGRALIAARLELSRAMAVSKQVAAMACREGASEVEIARQTGIDRMTVRKVLGKQ